jgi:hypothetical protein
VPAATQGEPVLSREAAGRRVPLVMRTSALSERRLALDLVLALGGQG